MLMIRSASSSSNSSATLRSSLILRLSSPSFEIVHLLGLLSFAILSTDGTLFPSYSHYKGCTYFCEQCASIEFKGLIENVRRRILYKLQEPNCLALGREIKVRVDCPSARFPEATPKPKVELLSLSFRSLIPKNPAPLIKSSESRKSSNPMASMSLFERSISTAFVSIRPALRKASGGGSTPSSSDAQSYLPIPRPVSGSEKIQKTPIR